MYVNDELIIRTEELFRPRRDFTDVAFLFKALCPALSVQIYNNAPYRK